jgi:protein required for attachment to host cells
MEHIRLPWRSWLLACDGAKAVIFQNDGDAELPNLTVVDHMAQDQPLTHELGADRPGRVFQSHGGAHSAVEQTDWHAQNEAAFLTRIAERLGRAAEERKLKHLVVAAPPRALGVLRQKLSPQVSALILREIEKDFTNTPTAELERHFRMVR